MAEIKDDDEYDLAVSKSTNILIKKDSVNYKKIAIYLTLFLLATAVICFIILSPKKISPLGSYEKEYIADEDYESSFGKSINEAKIITARNIKTAKDAEEKIFFIFKSFVDFEYRYLMAYPLFCSEHGVDLLPFMNKFEKNNEEIINKMETISASNKKIMEYKEKLYIDSDLKDFLNHSISEEFRDITSLPFSDICASFNASIHNEKTHSYSQVFPEFAEFIIRYTQNPETLILNNSETKEETR